MEDFNSYMITLKHFSLFCWGWIGLALIIFVALNFITAPYGRHTKAGWGPLIDNKLGWFLMEFFALLVLFYFVLTGILQQSLVNWIIIGLFTLHYLHRSIIFPLRIKTKGKKMPASIVGMGLMFNLVNGFLIGYYLGNFKTYSNNWLLSPQFITGTLIFIIGTAINLQSDNILIALRKPGETDYKIPQGGLFTWISCPNLFGEVIEWLGFAILSWNLPGFAFFIWTFANLIPRAVAHHRWYLSRFPDYPKERKAVIPLLW